jgi:hypothetical protein
MEYIRQGNSQFVDEDYEEAIEVLIFVKTVEFLVLVVVFIFRLFPELFFSHQGN